MERRKGALRLGAVRGSALRMHQRDGGVRVGANLSVVLGRHHHWVRLTRRRVAWQRQPQRQGPLRQRHEGNDQRAPPTHDQPRRGGWLRGRLDQIQSLACARVSARVRSVRSRQRRPARDSWTRRVHQHDVREDWRSGLEAAQAAIGRCLEGGRDRRDDVEPAHQPRGWLPVPAVPAPGGADGGVLPGDAGALCGRLEADAGQRDPNHAQLHLRIRGDAACRLDLAAQPHPRVCRL
mmetsp:Transcript_25457/g.51704  ORF Transcript_25457/g.51704 Transcript_25457/m.51704 type:complete len:236 (-) Transcript_25457:445-1152(-)